MERDLSIVRQLFRSRPDQNVVVLLEKKNKIIGFVFGKNIVTSEGDIYYAQAACGESLSHNFNAMWLASACSNANSDPLKTDTRANYTDIAGTQKAQSANYPCTNDPDADNTGSGNNVVSWLFSYSAGDGNWSGITHAYVTVNNNAGEHLLCGIEFAAGWAKDSNTSAKVFVNHGQNGV